MLREELRARLRALARAPCLGQRLYPTGCCVLQKEAAARVCDGKLERLHRATRIRERVEADATEHEGGVARASVTGMAASQLVEGCGGRGRVACQPLRIGTLEQLACARS